MANEKVSVRVGGKEFSLSSPDGPEHIQRVAEYADRSLREVMTATRLPVQTASILTLINLADDLVKSREECSLLRRQLEETRQSSK